ncbi:MAG: hypothetical protein JXP34_25615, partial [Planctomycetes bacterium]|nr:hypothetical protein [Planctomycetota bacterium]
AAADGAEATATDAARIPARPEGAAVVANRRMQDWYCTNRPQIGVRFRLPDWVMRRNIPKPGTAEFERRMQELLAALRARGIDTTKIEAFWQMLRRRAGQVEQGGELPSFLQSLGLTGPTPADPRALAAWRERMVAATDAFVMRLLESGDPALIAQGLRARAEALALYDQALQDHCEAAIQTIQANQKLTEEILEALPVVGDTLDLYAAATGRTMLTDIEVSGLERILRGASVLGPFAIGELLKRSPGARAALEALVEKACAMGGTAKQSLAQILKIDPKSIDDALAAIGEALTKERHLFTRNMDDKAQAASRAFLQTADGRAARELMDQDLDAAKDVLDRLRRAESPDDIHRAVLDLQANKTAQGIANGDLLTDQAREKFNRYLRGLYDQADGSAVRRLDDVLKATDETQLRAIAREMGVDVADLQKMRRDVERLARRNGLDPSQIEIKTKDISGNDMTKIGRDRDVTFSVRDRRTGADLGDIDHNVTRNVYDQEFYRASQRTDIPRLKDGTPDAAAIGRNSEMFDQAVTTGLHPEAYAIGEANLKKFLKGEQTIDHIEAFRDTFAHKSHEWFHRAAQAGDPTLAARNTAEGMRQCVKQYDRFVLPKLQEYGLKPAAMIPERIQSGMNILRQVTDGKIPPKQAESMLSAIGLTKERLVDDVVHFFEGVEKSTGRVFRAANADALARSIGQLTDRGGAGWADAALSQINDAWGAGKISGEMFQKFRTEALQGRIAQVAKVNTAEAWKGFSRWVTDAWTRRLISVTEKEALQQNVPAAHRG